MLLEDIEYQPHNLIRRKIVSVSNQFMIPPSHEHRMSEALLFVLHLHDTTAAINLGCSTLTVLDVHMLLCDYQQMGFKST